MGKYLTNVLEWKADVIKIDPTICKEPFPSDDEIFEKGGSHIQLMTELHEAATKTQRAVNLAHQVLDSNGNIPTLNGGVQPFICTVYGPTGSGKSQFVRNVISSQLIDPRPETVFFITPETGMVPKEEQLAWEAQCVEGTYNAYREPLTNVLKPEFVQISFRDAVSDENLNIENEKNIFRMAASKGPVCVIMDECMNQLGTCHSMSSFFHAMPSKLLGKYPKCTGFSVIVVLHNMNPRHDRGNVKDLKIQSKCHIISPQLESSQINRFVKMYGYGFATALTPVIKDIVDHARQNSQYSWLVYNNVPVNESCRWAYYSPDDQLKPIFMDLQNLYYHSCQDIRRVFRKKHFSHVHYYRRMNPEYTKYW